MITRHIDGLAKPGEAVILAPIQPVRKADILAALDAQGTWRRPNQIRMSLDGDKWTQIGINNIADRLRDMAHAGEIARRYDRHGRPEYRRIEE